MTAICNFLTVAVPTFCCNQAAKISQSLGLRKVKQQEPKDSPRNVISGLLVFLAKSEGRASSTFLFDVTENALSNALRAYPEHVSTILAKYEYDFERLPQRLRGALEKIRKEISSLKIDFQNEDGLYVQDWSKRMHSLATFFVNVRDVSLSKPGNLSQAVGWIADSFSKHMLTSLSISHVMIPYHKAMHDISHRLPHVTRVIFDTCSSLEVLQALSQKQNLEELVFVNCFIGTQALSELQNFAKLSTLTFLNCPCIRKGELQKALHGTKPCSFEHLKRLVLSPELYEESLKAALSKIEIIVKIPEPKKQPKSASIAPYGYLAVAGALLFIYWKKGPNLLSFLPFSKSTNWY